MNFIHLFIILDQKCALCLVELSRVFHKIMVVIGGQSSLNFAIEFLILCRYFHQGNEADCKVQNCNKNVWCGQRSCSKKISYQRPSIKYLGIDFYFLNSVFCCFFYFAGEKNLKYKELKKREETMNGNCIALHYGNLSFWRVPLFDAQSWVWHPHFELSHLRKSPKFCAPSFTALSLVPDSMVIILNPSLMITVVVLCNNATA